MAEEQKFAYLLMVTSEVNHNKVYRMSANGDNTWTAEYGRIGSSFQKRTYPMSQWKSKYNEKIRKGYTDQTDLVKDLVEIKSPKSSETVYKPIENHAIAEIVERLQYMAKQAIDENYNIKSNKVTQVMVDEAQKIITGLLNITDIQEFNNTLLKLFTTIPRKMGNVKDYLANSSKEFSEIIQKEQALLDVMRGQVVQHTTEDDQAAAGAEDQRPVTILEAMGLEFEECDSDDIQIIKKQLGECSGRFHMAWRVKNLRTQEKFDKFCTDEKIKEHKLLWHGSRNENWWSIVNSGLVLRPTNAVINGKMFGYGIYFAPKARKSLGYTSIRGSHWAHGSSDSAFMALMDVGYGKPYDAYSFDSVFRSFNYEKLQTACTGANCLHAHAGSMLYNDEIIIYKEDQVTIKYLVELR